MKGIHERFLQRNAQKSVSRSMEIYERVLDQLVHAGGDGLRYRQGDQELNKTIGVGEVVIVLCPDDPSVFRSVLIKKNDFSSAYQVLISNPVPGSPPADLRVVSSEQLFRRIRELNATTTSTDLRAFPVTVQTASNGVQAGSLVSDLHRSLQKRGGQ